jgi:hypothetical protein
VASPSSTSSTRRRVERQRRATVDQGEPAISTSRAHDLLAAHATVHEALISGFPRALLACSIAVLAVVVLAVRATNTRGGPVPTPLEVVPLPENA